MFGSRSDMDYSLYRARNYRNGALYPPHSLHCVVIPTPTRRIMIRLSLIMILAAIVAIYFLVDPSRSGWMPQCVFHRLTGWDCPGCGSQRMIHALLHGDLGRAWGYNPFFICMIPVILCYVWLDLFPEKTPRLFRFFHSPAMIASVGGSIIAWGILRNFI